MPTLSPHPPSIKEEVMEAGASAAQESQDAGGSVVAEVQSPAVGTPTSGVDAGKDKAAVDQVLW